MKDLRDERAVFHGKRGKISAAARLKKILRVALPVFVLAVLLSLLKGAGYVLLILAAAAIHECGHIFAAKILSVPFSRAHGGLFGLSLKYDFSSSSYLVQVIVSLAGAFFNIIACVLTMVLVKEQSYASVFFIFSNVAPAVFNLMPISPLDGSGVLSSLLSMVTSDESKAERITGRVSTVFSLAFFILTVYIQMRVGVSLSLMIISVILLWSCVKKGI